MPRISVQFLENAYPAASPQAVRERLRQAGQIMPIESVLLGWDLPPALEEAVASEASRQGAALYRWHPLLASESGAATPAAWQTIGIKGKPIPGFGGLSEFSFFCPNNPSAQAWIAERIDHAIQRGIYQGIFFDRMRWPSPVEDLGNQLGCFCRHCQSRAAQNGLDLEAVRRSVEKNLANAAGAKELVRALFAPAAENNLFENFFQFRVKTITRTVAACAKQARAGSLSIGLDCFSPSLARMVGQDLTSLAGACDWAKLMIYPHTFGPAGIPYELQHLADWLAKKYGIPQADGLQFVCETSSIWPRQPATLEREIKRGKAACQTSIFAGLALVEMDQVNRFSDEQLQDDLLACQASQPDGLTLSWDLWLIPARRLEMIAKHFFT